MYQFGLLPRIAWPMMMYEFPLTFIEGLERKCSAALRKWFGAPRNLTAVALYSKEAKLQLPVSAVTTEFKVSKARLVMTLKDSSDPVIRNLQPDVKTGQKWAATKAVEEAESQLEMNEIIGATQSDRLGLGMRENLWWSSLTPPQRRRQVAEEVKRTDDSLRVVQAVTQKQQGAWTTWEEVVQRKLDWNHIWKMGQHRVSFLLRAAYDVLPSPANLSRW